MGRTNVYVDGESHFIRTKHCWLAKSSLPLERAKHGDDGKGGWEWPQLTKVGPAPPYLHLEPRCKFFWDRKLLGYAKTRLRDPSQVDGIEHAAYFGAAAAAEEVLHDLRVFIRNFGFEPVLIKERSDLAKRRDKELEEFQLVEKPKGVDIAMAARILEDCYRNLFDACVLLTSDADYLPVIRSVQQFGKKVVVLGYQEGIGKRSELEYVPDSFIDCEPYVKQNYIPI